MSIIRTNNKIAACLWCLASLTPAQDSFCNEVCKERHEENEATRPKGEEMYVYCNLNMLNLAIGEKVRPHEFSYFLFTGHELVCVALFTQSELETIPDRESNTYDAWYREVGHLNISIEPHQPRVMRDEGLESYLCDRFGISTERNVASAIGEIAVIEGVTPIGLFNTL